jgi:hypothetical protein
VDRLYPPEKYEILPYADTVAGDGVEDDLGEISSLAFATHGGGQYAYGVVSDKSQFSLKVVKFTDDVTTTNVLTGQATTVANYTLNDVPFDNDDWADISLGPCTDDAASAVYTIDQTCIYIGNFGNNNRGGGYVQREFLNFFNFQNRTLMTWSHPRIKQWMWPPLNIITVVRSDKIQIDSLTVRNAR